MGDAQPCYYCGRPSTILCDGTLGHEKEPGATVAKRGGRHFTCDRPLCPAHIKERMRVHYNARPRHYWDSLDYCEDCIREERNFGDSRILHGRQRLSRLLTMEEGLAMQRRRMFHAKMEVHARAAGDSIAIAGARAAGDLPRGGQ
jgi:hypothetical protein